MTKTFSALIAALAIAATLAIDVAPAAAADTATEASGSISGGDLGSGRVDGASRISAGVAEVVRTPVSEVTDLTGMSSGSGR